jgi:chromate transporter
VGVPRLRDVAAVFGRVGNLTFGGGDPIVATLQLELVERRGWISRDQHGLAFGLARVTPGTNVLAFSAATAWMARGWAGAVVAVVAASLPSALVAFALAAGYATAQSIPAVRAAMAGIAAAVVGIVVSGALRLVRPAWFGGGRARMAVLTGGSMACSHWLGWPPVPILLAAAVVGYYWRE